MAPIALNDIIVGQSEGGDGFRLVVDELSWEQGQFGAIAGPAGAGKSLLLAVMAGGAPVDRGAVLVDGADGRRQPVRARGWHDARAVVYERMSVRGHVDLAARASAVDGRAPFDREALLEALSLAPVAGQAAGRLDYALQLRVSLARLLARTDLAALLLDDPFSALDAPAAAALAADLGQATALTGTTVLLACTSPAPWLSVIDDLVLLDAGRVVGRGRPDVLFDDPPTLAAALAIGDPPINRLAVAFQGGRLCVGGRAVNEPLPDRLEAWLHAQQVSLPQSRIVHAIRPEHLTLVPAGSPDSIGADLLTVTDRGDRVVASVQVGETRMLASLPADSDALTWLTRLRQAGERSLRVGLRLFTPQCHFFRDGVRL